MSSSTTSTRYTPFELRNEFEYLQSVKDIELLYENGASVTLTNMATNGSPVAQYYLGLMYKEGKGVIQNNEHAFHWFQESAGRNYTNGLFSLGFCYLYGVGVAANINEAITLFEAILKTNPCHGGANFYIGEIYKDFYHNELGAYPYYLKAVENDYAPAVEALKRYCNEEDPNLYTIEAVGKMALRLLNGIGLPRNVDLGKVYLLKAVQHNDLPSCYSYACFLEKGRFFNQDSERAREIFTTLAQQGHKASIGALSKYDYKKTLSIKSRKKSSKPQ